MKTVKSIRYLGKKYMGLSWGGYRDIYEVSFNDGSTIETDEPSKYSNIIIIKAES